MNLGALRLLKYVSSFVDGRVRIRHPALRRPDVLALAESRMRALAGVSRIDGNSATGSVLIEYDAKAIPRSRVLDIGAAWARYLDAVEAGRDATVPDM